MSKAPSSTLVERWSYTVVSILLLGKIMPSYSCYAKEGLVCIIIASPINRQPSFYAKCTRANMRSSYNVRSIFNAKYTRFIPLNSL